MNLRTIVVDDEPLAVRRLQIALSRIGGVELLGTASDGTEALELIRAYSPDLILLDIKMPMMGGFDLLNSLGSGTVPEIIFVTAYSDFAVSAFEAGAVGYVLKPIDEDRLRTAIDRARVKLRTQDAEARLASLSTLMNKVQQSEAPSETPYEQELWISRGTTIERVAVQDVERFEAAGDYVAVHCKEREYLLHDSLRSLVQRLDPDDFARVHRKSIVRLGAIDAINRGKFGALDLTMASGHRVPVSRPYRRDLQSRIMAGRPDGSGENASVGDLSAPIGEK